MAGIYPLGGVVAASLRPSGRVLRRQWRRFLHGLGRAILRVVGGRAQYIFLDVYCAERHLPRRIRAFRPVFRGVVLGSGREPRWLSRP